MAAVLQVLGHSSSTQAAGAGGTAGARRTKAQPSSSREAQPSNSREAQPSSSRDEREVEDDQALDEENLRAPSFYRGPPPSMQAMRAAGYLGSEQELKSIWAWARDSEQEVVWPTPVSGMQEAVRFDAMGWPTATSSAEEWITCVSFWTALREQLVGGASRSQRRAVTSTLAGFKSN